MVTFQSSPDSPTRRAQWTSPTAPSESWTGFRCGKRDFSGESGGKSFSVFFRKGGKPADGPAFHIGKEPFHFRVAHGNLRMGGQGPPVGCRASHPVDAT